MENKINTSIVNKSNLLRLLLSFVYSSMNMYLSKEILINTFFWVHFIFSLFWFVLHYFNYINEERFLWLSYIPASIDIIGSSLLIISTGNIHSSFIVVYFIIVSLSSLNIRKKIGLYAFFFSTFMFISIGLLVFFQLIPNINIFSATTTEVNISNLIVSTTYISSSLLAINYIIYNTYNNFTSKNNEFEILLLKASKQNEELEIQKKSIEDLNKFIKSLNESHNFEKILEKTKNYINLSFNIDHYSIGFTNKDKTYVRFLDPP